MTTLIHSQQPDLRAFIVFDRPQAGLVPFLVTNNAALPFLRPGDTVLVDPDDRQPSHGEMFLIEWMGGQRQIVSTRFMQHPERIVDWDGQPRWNACWRMSARSMAGGEVETLQWTDGPYRTEGIASKLVGRVVGIIETAFVEPKRIAEDR